MCYTYTRTHKASVIDIKITIFLLISCYSSNLIKGWQTDLYNMQTNLNLHTLVQAVRFQRVSLIFFKISTPYIRLQSFDQRHLNSCSQKAQLLGYHISLALLLLLLTWAPDNSYSHDWSLKPWPDSFRLQNHTNLHDPPPPIFRLPLFEFQSLHFIQPSHRLFSIPTFSPPFLLHQNSSHLKAATPGSYYTTPTSKWPRATDQFLSTRLTPLWPHHYA